MSVDAYSAHRAHGHAQRERIVAMVQRIPQPTLREMGAELGISHRGVHFHIEALVREGRLAPVGYRRGRYQLVAHEAPAQHARVLLASFLGWVDDEPDDVGPRERAAVEWLKRVAEGA